MTKTLTLALLLGVATALPAQQLPQTWQEQNNFRAGPTPFDPLMEFWYELDEISELVSMQPLTRTLLDRQMYLITIAEPTIRADTYSPPCRGVTIKATTLRSPFSI